MGGGHTILTALAPDVLLDIISYLTVKEILLLRLTCKSFKQLADSHAVWHSAVHHQLLPYGLLLPVRKEWQLAQLSAQELKAAAVYAARLDHSWHNPSWTRNFNSIEWQPETPCQSVPMALLVPGTAGRYLLTITRNCLIRIWELEPNVRRHWLRIEWEIKGTVLDVAMNSDPTNPATFAISYNWERTEWLNLYNLKCGLGVSHSLVYHGGLVGRMKILRGDLVVSYRPSRSRVHIVNYRTGAIAWLPNLLQPPSAPSCHAVEVCHGCVVVVQLWGIDVFELPDSLKVDDPPKTIEGEPIVAIGQVIATKYRALTSRWTAAAIVPYAPPYPHVSRQQPDRARAISILIRERLGMSVNTIHHEQICLLPDFPPLSIPSEWPSSRGTEDAIKTKTHSLKFTKVQTRHSICPHFFHEIVTAPASGHGFWIENMTSGLDHQSNEKLMLFSAVRNTRDYPEDDPLIDIGGENAEPARFRPLEQDITSERGGRDGMKPQREGTVRWCLQHTPALMRGASHCSFDDSVGRIVIATHNGKVRVVDLGSAVT